MPRSRWGAARLATVLLLAMVGVAGEAMPAPPVPPTNHTVEEDYEYYYDYDYYYQDGGPRRLNATTERRPGQPYVPRYMLELYAEQSLGRSSPLPGADLVRSFTATSTDSLPGGSGRVARQHTLGFNVTMPRGEHVTNATLRLYTLITRDQYAYIGVERRVRVEMRVPREEAPQHSHSHSHGSEGAEGGVVTVRVAERDIYELHNAWETFDVTPAVRYWLQHPASPQLLQIYIESVFSTVGSGGDMDVATVPLTDSEPLLLVYSSVRHRKQARHELRVMIAHEHDVIDKMETQRRKRSVAGQGQGRPRRRRNAAEIQEEESNMIWEGELDIPGLPQHAHNSLGDRMRGRRGRRRRAKNGCKKKPLQVNFKDIGWDDWIIAPESYEAGQCTGKCFYPLASHLSPTKHAVVQTLMNSVHPDRSARSCCVPTKLGPISLLYFENNTPTHKYQYDDMVVLECGCR